MDIHSFLILLLTWRFVACENNSTYSEVSEEDDVDSYMPQKNNEDAQYDSGWIPMTSADSESKLSNYESSSVKSSTEKLSDGSTENNVPLLDGILPFGNQLLQQGSISNYPSNSYRTIAPSQTGNFNYFPGATANIPLGYSLSFGQSIPTYGSTASYPVTQQRENNIYSGTNLIANVQASPDYSKGTKQIITGNYKSLIPKTTEHTVKVTTQDFASPFFKNSAYYGNMYSPTTQKLTVSDPNGYIFGGNLPINYNFNPAASFSFQQAAPSSVTTNATNSQYAQYPLVNVAATSPISLSNLPAYNGQILNANSFPGFTGQQVLSPYQFSSNNLFKNTVAPTSFSSGIYHNQPALQNNQLIQQYPLTQPYTYNSGLNTYSNQNKQQNTVHPRPQVHLGPQTYPITGQSKYTKPINSVKNTQHPTTYNSYSSTEKPSNYKPSSNYKPNYYNSEKYNSEDDSKSSSPYKSDHDNEDESERYTSTHHDDYHDDDDKGNYEESFDSSDFPSASNFFKNSRPFEKNFFNDHDSDSTNTYPRAPKPTAPRYSDKKYNNEPYRSSSSYSERGAKYDEDNDNDDHQRYTSKSPSSRYQSGSRPASKKSNDDDVPTLFRPYKYKPPSYADERSTEFLGKPGPVKVMYRDKYYEEIKMRNKDDDSDGEHSEQNPQSIKSAITTEDKKSDYYSYTFTKEKIMQ